MSKTKSSDKSSKAKKKAHKTKPTHNPYTITIRYPGIVEVYGQVVDRSDTHITIRSAVHRSRGKVQDVAYPMSSIRGAFHLEDEQATLLLDSPSFEYDEFEVSTFEVVGGMYVFTDDEGQTHMVHPSVCTVRQLHSVDDLPLPKKKKKVKVVAPSEDPDDENEDAEEDTTPEPPAKVRKAVPPPVAVDDGEDDEDSDEDEDEENLDSEEDEDDYDD